MTISISNRGGAPSSRSMSRCNPSVRLAPGASRWWSHPASKVFTVGVNHIVNELSTATAVSVSLGGCEPNVKMFEDGLAASFQQLLDQGLAEGQTWSAATGDNGSDDCQDGKTVAVDFPSSVPGMVAAGGASISLRPTGIRPGRSRPTRPRPAGTTGPSGEGPAAVGSASCIPRRAISRASRFQGAASPTSH